MDKVIKKPVSRPVVAVPDPFSSSTFQDFARGLLEEALRGVEFNAAYVPGIKKTKLLGKPVVANIPEFIEHYVDKILVDPDVVALYKPLNTIRTELQKLEHRREAVEVREERLKKDEKDFNIWCEKEEENSAKEEETAAKKMEKEYADHTAKMKTEREELAGAVADFTQAKELWEREKSSLEMVMRVEAETKVYKDYSDLKVRVTVAEGKVKFLADRCDMLRRDRDESLEQNDEYRTMLNENFERFTKIALKGLEMPEVTAEATVDNSTINN